MGRVDAIAAAGHRVRAMAGSVRGDRRRREVTPCRSGVSCQPLTVPEPCSVLKVDTAPSSTAQYLTRYCGGLLSALPTSTAFTITVFLPLPIPSFLPTTGGIL